MIRPITTIKPPPPPRIDPKANAEQITRLQAEATKLRNEIRLANKMGESDAAASARQRLTQVNAELTTAQSAAPASQPTPPLAPMLPTAGAATPQGNGGTTTFPTLFTTQNFGGSSPKLVLAGYTPPDESNPSPEVTKAEDIVKDIEGGKSIDNIAEERKMTPEEVVAALNAGGMTATATEYANGDTRQVVITDGNGRTITENQDYQHGGYYTEVTGPDGETTSSPIRDDLGRKETTSVDPETGAITTKYVADLGDGTVTERTTDPQTRITTTTETNGEGVVTVTKNLPNGSTVKTVTPNNSVALPVTTVTGPGGEEVTLAQTQTSDGSGAPSIQDQLAEGKSFEEIAEERGLTPEQIIAELNAAGFEVTQGGDPGETLQIVVTDPDTGRTVTYNNDYHHGSRSVTVTEGKTETTDSVDGNGRTSHTERNTETGEQTTTIVDPKNNTETTIVFDKEGRRTETIVEKLNDGEPIEYEVKPGDNLSDIAEAYGVTLEELAKSNPELFTSPRDPDLIHPGETVVIEGATKTTVNVTFNGYTLTTAPDGNVTLTNDTTGAVIDIVEGTAQEALAGLLMDINPNSSDPEKAKEDQILKTALDGIFGGATPQLTTEALEKQQAVLDAIRDYGPSKPATPSLEGTPTSVGPFGEPPSATAPSGGKWVPLMVDGNWQWFDPKVAAAIAAENVGVSRLGEAQAKSTQSAAQLDVYALDPEYDQAMEDAEATLDGVLAPYGGNWKPPEPKGTLAEAQERLNLANTALESATTARTEYEEGQQALLEAIEKQVDLPGLSDPNQEAASSTDGPSPLESNQQGKAEHAEVAELFTNVSLHTANGNKATVDQLVATTDLELKLTDAKPGSAEYKAIEERLEGLQTLQGAAAGQVTLAEAYQEYGVAQSDAADLAVTMEPLKQQLLAQARERNPHHFDWEGYTNGHNEFTGKILSQEVIEENGQLYLVTTYENDVFLDENNNDTNVNKYALTYDLNDEGIREDFRNDPLNKQWQEMVASTQQTSSSAPVCTANGTGSQSALDAARSKIVGAQVELLDAGLQDAKTALVDATAARDQAITDYGAGTVEPPAGTLKPGEQAVKIKVDGHDVWVAPEVAIAFEKDGPSAIGASGKPVQIEIDGQKLWVHPEIAAAEIERSRAENDKERLENWEKDVRPAMVAGRDWYAFSASHPKLLELGAAQHRAELKNEYFEEHREQAMASYRVGFDGLYEAGFTGEYKEYTSSELSGTVAQTLGLDPSSEGVEKVVDEITDRAGDNPEVKLVPIFSLDGGMESSTALFEIKTGDGETGYVDTSGKYYDSFDEFQHENRIFSEDGNLVMAKGGDMSLGKDGFTLDELEVADGRKVDFWDRATDIGLGIVAGVSTIISFVPGGQWAIPIAITSGAALGGKALVREGEHLLQGGEFDSQSAWNITMGVTSFLPVGAGALRTFGLARAGLPASKSLAGGFGMGQMQNASWGVGKFRVNVQQSSYADDVKAFMQSGSKLNTAAWGLDAGAVVTGVPLLGKSIEDLAAHGGEMSLLELANAVMGIGTGLVGTGLGGRGLLNNMPGGGGPRSGAHPSGSFPGGPESGPRPRAVYEMGADGVYRPTGEHVMPDPDEIIIQGDVVGETTGTNRPTGPRALPAGDTNGPNQPPPTDGRFDPSGDGQSSRPMVVHEQGADGVHRPTDRMVFHDSSHPVVEGTVVNVHDDATAPGERGDAESARDGSANGARELNARPADSDPIVVPTTARETGTTSGNDSGGFGRLTWDPVTKSFTGFPEPNTADYIYTSGKDPSTPSVYLDGVRPGDPMVKFTPEELLARYEQESRYYSSREMAERYGPNGVELPERSLQQMLPDFRVGVTFRLRLNTGEMLDIGSPTIAAVGFGIGTKTDFGHIGWSVVDSVSQKSLTPLKDALGTQGVVSVRTREFLNITGLQAGVWPVSKQTAFPIRASDLGPVSREGLFTSTSGYNVKPSGAAIVGTTKDGATVIEIAYTPYLKASPTTLANGQHDFFGAVASDGSKHVTVEGKLPFDRVMTETKAGLRLPILANHVSEIDQLPRLGVEIRPESPVKDTLKSGDVVSREAYDQIQAALGSVTLHTQFAVKDPAKASEIVAALERGDVSILHDMAKSGDVDPAAVVSFVQNPLISGLRLSAVPGKAPSTDMTMLTGETRRVANPEAMLVDVVFNDTNNLPGILATNPDRVMTSLSYKLKKGIYSLLPDRFTPDRPPQSRSMPTSDNIARNLQGGYGTPQIRYTFSASTPPAPAGPGALTAEVRLQYKSKGRDAARSIAKNETTTLAFNRSDGRSGTLDVPSWLADTAQTAHDRSPMLVPKGGKASLDQFLGELEAKANPGQKAAIEQFRDDFGSVIVDGKFVRADAANGVLTFLATQAADGGGGPLLSPKPAPRGNGSPHNGRENVHVPLTDFDAAMNALGAGPQRPAIEAAPPTTHTLDQVRNMRQPHKWRAGEQYTRELNGSPGEKHFPVDADPNGKYPIVGEGGRYVDAPVYNARGDIEAIEVKTYHRWRTVNSVAEMREVPLSQHLRQQINKDIALRDKDPAYQPRWVFLDAPPSPELQNALNDARIIGNIMGHNKPSKTRAVAGSNENPSGGPKLTDAELAANREEALQLFDGVIRQDLRISDMTILDLADQFSRSPTLMSLLRTAHEKQVRIVNSARSDLHIQDVNMPDHDVNARGIFYDPALKVITLDGDQLAQEATNLTPDVVVGEQAGRLAHELSHVGDPDYLNPADFADEATFVDAYVNASLQDEGRARFTEFKVAEELAENGGAPSNILTYADPAEVAVFENYRSGAIDETTAVNQLGDLFGQMEPSYGSGTNYHAHYTENAQTAWAYRPGQDGNETFTGSTGQDGVRPGPAANPSGSSGSRPAAAQPLTRDGVRGVPLDQVQNLNMADFQPNQVGWLTREQVAKLTEQQFGDMDRLGLLPHLTKSQLRGIPKNRIGDVNVAGLAERQIPWLTNGQVGKLSEQQFQALGEAGLHRHLTKSQLQGIPGNKIGFLDVSTLDATQIPWLKPKQIANFTQKQLGDISESGVLALLSKEQLRAIPETDIVVINTAKLDARQVPWLTDGQVAQLTEKQLQALGEAGLLKHLAESQLGAIPDTKIGAIDVTKLDASQVPWLTDVQIANLTEQQFKDLGESGLLRNFTESQVKAIPAERLDVAKLDPTQVPWLTDAQIAALTRDQWGGFTVNHIEALTRPQIEAMTPKQFEELSPGQFRKFTLEQFEWMSTDQANALSVLQLTTFKTAYRKTMTPSQRNLVEGALVYSRVREHQMALDTFGTMAGTSYMLWSSLPPHWTATAGGVMFALRGVVFSAQSVFPNATAPHTRLGRALNLASGLSFIASSPGSAAPLFQSGTNPLVNGTFTLGNMIYGTKSTMQAFTGRTVMRLLGDHVGNFAYLSGSIAYTAQNLHSPLGWISGGLFTLGSAEFWGSAIRTEVLNRKAPPRTDAEIAAAAKADKRWAAWDRIALGVTFGIGMFLFAWDTLDGEPWKVAAPGGQDPTKPDEPTGTDQPDEPDDPPSVKPEPEPEPEEYPQLVVTADDGLNLRATPGADGEKVTVLEPGTFVEQTGKPSTDAGETWIPVEGFGPDGKTYTGWVASDHVATHPEGASNPEGRTNPKLEESGYEWVEVQDGDSIRLIASNRSADVAETVVLNMDHILSPDVIFAGDRIYLPMTATG